ncbi:MAG: hypothetical protein ABL921_01750 [Pirellula sp.]
MLRPWIASALVCSAIIVPSSELLLAQSSTAGSQQEEPVYWPRLDFVIPFNVDVSGQAPREIQLEYSSDGGASWDVYKRSDVRTKQFQFQAKADGEYAFRLKTIDNQGRLFENPGAPLRIFVDTAKPEGSLIIDMDRRGDMLAEFTISDAALDIDTIELTYYTQADPKPRAIEFELANGEAPGVLIGKGNWKLPSGTQSIAVRLVAKDKAGNSLEVNRMPQLPRSAAANNGGMQLASGKTREHLASSPIGTGIPNSTDDALPKIQVLNGPGARPPVNAGPSVIDLVEQKNLIIEQQRQLIDQQSIARKQIANSGLFGTGLNGIPSNENSSENSEELQSTRQPKPKSQPAKHPESLDFLTAGKQSAKMPVREMTDEEIRQATAPPMSLVAKKSGQSILIQEQDSIGLPRPAELSPTPPARVEIIEGQTTFRNNIKPLFSSAKSFSLEYGIENDPDSPILSVELWGTTDQGQTWQAWGQDPDRASPFDIQVETEGLFGFRMVIVGANGLASNRPRNGDNADAWIHVDTQRPRARIASALYGKGKEAGSMVIEYNASDDYFPDRPITLSYSESPEGPWKTIATSIRNNGRYVWPADPSLPQSLFLRLEAMDAAGNVGVHRLDTPIDVQGLAPRGRIQGFRPHTQQGL